jgi:Tfp pilus assembly protein PilF
MACATMVLGCVAGSGVERVYDGDVVVGRFVGGEAYAAFLRGAIADADGHPDEALRGYEEAAARQPWSAEIWTRIGAVRCRQSTRDPQSEAALSRAIAIDGAYAPAWAARATCALARGDTEAARVAARRAATLDPGADDANALLARTSPGDDPALRARLVALTATARNPAVAWDALASWAEASGDVPLRAQALRELARKAPSRRVAVAVAAEELAGWGELGEARSVAAAAVDSSSAPLPDGHPIAARLAVDEAIARRDVDAVRARATRARLPLDEAAGRALLAGDRTLARELASELSHADPGARGARLVLAACAGGDLAAAIDDGSPGGAPVASAALVAFGLALARSAPLDRARAVLLSMGRGTTEPIVNGDDRVERAAVELAQRGVLDTALLPGDARVELALLRGGPAPSELVPAPLDARHEYLSLALRSPTSPRARELGRRLSATTGDPVVAAAAALVALGSDAPISPGAPAALLARNAADPLLAAVALELAERVGDREVAGRARKTLTAFGGAAPLKE